MSDRGVLNLIPGASILADRIFFKEHPDRNLRIRVPFRGENTQEFRQFGYHDESRRRIIVSRVAAEMQQRHKIDFMRIPFLLFADETVEDRDDVLRPILDEMMRDAAQGYGMKRR